MSVLQYPEAINAENLHIYNNAAFDDAADPSSNIKDSWVPLQPISLNPSEPQESDPSKENRSPSCKSPVSTKSPLPANRMSQGKPLKLLFKQGLLHPPPPTDPKNIDDEIQQIEDEIDRLSSKLEALRIEKSGHDTKANRRQSVGRIVPAKFMQQKQTPATKKTDESPASFRRRRVSLGPSEISASGARPTKPEDRRKSCFWKLPAVGEEEEGNEKKGGRSLSLSPKSRPSIRRTVDPRRGISTVGSKKPAVKRDQSTLTCLKPKALFGTDTCTASKPSKNSRVVPSRYGQTMTTSQAIENEKRRTRGVLSSSSRTPVPESRAKRRWDVPAQAGNSNNSPSEILRRGEELPKIRTVRCGNGSPRDSGAAKRVADLMGRKSYFDDEEEEEEEKSSSIRQALQFEEEEEI